MNRSLTRLKGDLRTSAKVAAGPAFRAVGLNLLSKDKTQARLDAHSVKPSAGSYLYVVSVCERDVRRIEVLRAGLVRLNRHDVLDLDYGNRSALQLQGGRLPIGTVDHALVAWSHLWTGYYHWVVEVLPRICAFQAEYGTALGGRFLCYPSFGERFEGEYLRLLGVPLAQVVDTRHYRRIRVEKDLALMPLKGWYRPSGIATPAMRTHPAIRLLRDRLIGVGTATGPSRLYVSRGGRRVVTNEDQVVATLASYGFEVVEDRQRPVEEQIGLFKHASVVVAPHGAALANLLWCRPGTLVIELLPTHYKMVHYRDLCSMLDLRYHALTETSPSTQTSHWTASRDDLTVNVDALRRTLEEKP
jgi:capsular polysaccharide biosynthesis protein